MGEERKVFRVLVGKQEGKRPLGKPRRRWEDGIRMDLREIVSTPLLASSRASVSYGIYARG
jgi:hypothetical protein